MPYRVLVTGDIHLGRTSTRLPGGFPPASARAVSAWQELVDHAISRRVSLVVLTGDITDRDNRFWEAMGPLERGVQRLGENDIHTLAVSGNHDHEVLPRLADRLEGTGAFTLLGRGGRWSRHTVTSDGTEDGTPILHVDGWSFPGEVVEFDPVESYPFEGGSGCPILGVVHGDLGAPASRYAPLNLARLRERPVHGWLLGHIHKPRLEAESTPFVLYPGSPQALDFGERGVHGAWVIEIEDGRVSIPKPVPLSICRYEEVSVDITRAETEADLERLVLAAMHDTEARCRAESGAVLRALSLRLRLTGRSPWHGDPVARLVANLGDYEGSDGDLALRIDRVRSEVLPAIDLDALAAGTSPLGVTARLLRDLDATPESEETLALVHTLRRRLADVAGGSDFVALRDEATADEEMVRSMARERLTFILSQLLAQQDGAT